MDMNVVVLAGRLATTPVLRAFDSGVTAAEMLVSVREDEPRRRIDVLPVMWWDPDDEVLATLEKGCGIWIAGRVQRTFKPGTSKVVIVAQEVALQLRGDDDDTA